MKHIVSLLPAAVLAPLILCQSAVAKGVSSSVPPQQNSGSIQKAAVFMLDASNSVSGNDRSRLVINSIAQLIHSLPSDYVVGVATYSTDVVAAQGTVNSGGRDSTMKAADSIRYIGYINANMGFTKALELLDTVEAPEKTAVMPSDGEIVIQDDTAAAVSFSQLENAVTEAKNSGVVIHVIGLRADMENKANTIFSVSTETGGANYHAPGAEGIQQVVGSIFLEQPNIKKTTVAAVDAGGGTEELDITIPIANATNAKLLFISDSPTRSLSADFSAGSVRQISGTYYTFLELDHPGTEKMRVGFQGAAGSQVKVDAITEYHITLTPSIVYKDTEPADEGMVSYDRTAQISIAFYDVENPERQVLTDSIFEGRSLTRMVGGQAWSGVVRADSVAFPPQGEVSLDKTKTIYISLGNLDTNIIV